MPAYHTLANGISDHVPDGCAHCCSNSGAYIGTHTSTNYCANFSSDGDTNAGAYQCADSVAYSSADDCTNIFADTSPNTASVPHRRARMRPFSWWHLLRDGHQRIQLRVQDGLP